jgi:hypothetical protein
MSLIRWVLLFGAVMAAAPSQSNNGGGAPARVQSALYVRVPSKTGATTVLVGPPQAPTGRPSTGLIRLEIPENATGVVVRADGRELVSSYADYPWRECDRTPSGQVIGYELGAECTIGAAGFVESRHRQENDGSEEYTITYDNQSNNFAREFRLLLTYNSGVQLPGLSGSACFSAQYDHLSPRTDGRLALLCHLRSGALRRKLSSIERSRRLWMNVKQAHDLAHPSADDRQRRSGLEGGASPLDL